MFLTVIGNCFRFTRNGHGDFLFTDGKCTVLNFECNPVIRIGILKFGHIKFEICCSDISPADTVRTAVGEIGNSINRSVQAVIITYDTCNGVTADSLLLAVIIEISAVRLDCYGDRIGLAFPDRIEFK